MGRNINFYQVLLIEDNRAAGSVAMCDELDRLAGVFEENHVAVLQSGSYADALPVAMNNMDIDCYLVTTDMNWNVPEDLSAIDLLRRIRFRQPRVPVFLLADRARTTDAMSPELMELVNEFVWIFEDAPDFIVGRVKARIARFREELFPPLMKAVIDYNRTEHEYSWAAPGHQGGVGFTKNPVGKKYYDFYGENLFRTDLGVERTSLGSLLDHEGAFGDSEKFAAKVFGADETYSVVVGTSGSNRAVIGACVGDGDPAICDRNCHKSIEQGLIQTGGVPVYLRPTRNRYGIIGPIPEAETTPEAIRAKIAALTLPHAGDAARYAVFTNCTYDGICYNAARVESRLTASTPRLHYDEAWYGYARFHPLYENHFAMRGDPGAYTGDCTIFATQSTHKMLNALSQASYIHQRHGAHGIPAERFNPSYMMQSTTSPLYAICVSNDVSSAMMNDCGEALMGEVIGESVDFRQALARLYREFSGAGEWFFRPWNPGEVNDGHGRVFDFADAPRALLCTRQACWRLIPGENWHGFAGLTEDWAMLDPIKVSILSPGMGDDGAPEERGVPSQLVAKYLYREGIVPTRTTQFQMMFLFSMGITKGKWGTLITALLNFKHFYDTNAAVSEVLPSLVRRYPAVYGGAGVRDLGDRMFDFLRRRRPEKQLDAAFEELPKPVMTPRAAYAKIVSGDVESVPADRLAHRVAANAVIPYPPGIPMLMSGESFGAGDSPAIRYLRMLGDWDREFPGFEHVTEGAESVGGAYHVLCVKP